MPVLPGSDGGFPTGGSCLGMTRSDIIELANQMTERKGEKVLSLPLLFSHVLQDFCGRSRYWWRHYYATFSTVASQSSYDFSDSTVFTPDLSELGVEEITQVALIQAGQNPPISYLEPMFDPRTDIEMRQGLNSILSGTAGVPGRYFVGTNSFNILRIDVPSGVFQMAVTFWAMPNKRTDSAQDCVPLVPPWHHKALVSGMEAKIWKRVEGVGSKQYLSAKAEYEEYIVLAQARPSFTTNRSQQLIQTDRAIRST